MLRYAKMNGAGNSILVVDERGTTPSLTGDMARALCRGPLAFDQLMALSDPAAGGGADAAVRIFNTDGSRAGACGNGSRCVAWFMAETGGGEAAGETVVLDVDGARVSCRREGSSRFTVDMGPPRLGWRDIPLREAADTLSLDLGDAPAAAGLGRPAAVGMGNPHAVFFVRDATAIDLAAIGPRFEHHPMFPDRVNVSFAEVRGPEEIRLRVWERGAGATLACGSAACATVVAASLRGLTGRRARVALPGGELDIDWRADGTVMMTGPVELEHRGRLDITSGDTAPW